jgi:sec-independent protein translocase protein TatA
MRPQAWHIVLLLVVVLLVFGASRLPDITRNVGKSLKIFKEEVKDLREDGDTVRDAADTTPQQPTTRTDPVPPTELPPTSVAPPHQGTPTHDAQPPSGR